MSENVDLLGYCTVQEPLYWFFNRHSILNGLESWSGVLEWSGVKIGVDFGVEFGVDFGVKFGVAVEFFFFFRPALKNGREGILLAVSCEP